MWSKALLRCQTIHTPAHIHYMVAYFNDFDKLRQKLNVAARLEQSESESYRMGFRKFVYIHRRTKRAYYI